MTRADSKINPNQALLSIFFPPITNMNFPQTFDRNFNFNPFPYTQFS